jgi:Tropinone reductase 1
MGIGLAIAREFVDLGAHVALVARDDERLQQRVGELSQRTTNGEVFGLAHDLSRPETLDRLPAWVSDHWGGLDILVNNVGTNIRKPALGYDLDEYQALIDANLTSCFELTRLCHPLLRVGTEPAVVNIASVAGMTHMRTGAPYAMSKAAMIQLTRNLACEWAADGIRVNCIAVAADAARPGRPTRGGGCRRRVPGDGGVVVRHRPMSGRRRWFYAVRVLAFSAPPRGVSP